MTDARTLEPQSLLSTEYTVHPALLVRAGRVERRQRLQQAPEPRIGPHSVLDQEALQGICAASREKQHRLMSSVKYRLTLFRSTAFAPGTTLFGLLDLTREAELELRVGLLPLDGRPRIVP